MDELHTPELEPAGGAPVDQVALKQERMRKQLETRRRNLETKRDRQRKAAERREAKRAAAGDAAAPSSSSSSSPAPGDDAGEDAFEKMVREELDRPLTGPKDLAEVLGKLQMTAVGLAEGTEFEDAAWSLQWTNGTAALPRAKIASRMIWPWLKRNGLDIKLAEQSDSVLALIGVAVLVGPSIGPVRAAFRARKEKAQAEANKPPVQLVPPPAAEQPKKEMN